jgi:very-short-patch-repair endonuclease
MVASMTPGMLLAPAVAERQSGVFTSTQALAEGLTQRQVRYRLATGRWRCVLGKGLSVGPPPTSGWSAGALAWAATLTWPDVVLGFRLAGVLHGFPITVGTPVDVYVRRRHRPMAGLIAHRGPLEPEELVELRRGLSLTSVPRTAIDCLSSMPLREGIGLYAWLTAHDCLDRARLTEAVAARTGRRGVGTLRELQRSTRSGAVSEAERRMHALLEGARITGWQAGVRISDADGVIGVVDVCFPAQRVVVEIDGRSAHSTPRALLHDRRRQNRLALAGYVVLRFTWSDLVSRPGAVVSLVRRALQQRRQVLSAG